MTTHPTSVFYRRPRWARRGLVDHPLAFLAVWAPFALTIVGALEAAR